MCTVTFIPLSDRILITSNRDEQTLRAPAELPEAVELKTGKVLFPKDGKAGGTWIAMHNNGNVMVLLNGAFHRHEPAPPYRKSRGLIFLDIFDSANPEKTFELTDLTDIEPFTLVIWQGNKLFETRWDGKEKYITPLPPHTPRIWSSATLYDDQVVAKRKAWFQAWLQETKYITTEGVRQFHEFGGDGDEAISLRMNRAGILQTVSITSIEITSDRSIMHYRDFNAGLVSVTEWFHAIKQNNQ